MSIENRKESYIARAIAVFKQDGLRLSLEEVAAKMNITKKTLYNHFASKDELMKECIRSISADMQEAIAKLDMKGKSAIENLRSCFSELNILFETLSPVFFHDIMRMNPGEATAEHLIGSGLFQVKMGANLLQGMGEGIYRQDIDVVYASQYLAYSVFGFYINSIIKLNVFLSKSYFEDAVEYHLRALVSDKGRQLL